MISRLSASTVCVTSGRNERVVVSIPQIENAREREAAPSPGCVKECSPERVFSRSSQPGSSTSWELLLVEGLKKCSLYREQPIVPARHRRTLRSGERWAIYEIRLTGESISPARRQVQSSIGGCFTPALRQSGIYRVVAIKSRHTEVTLVTKPTRATCAEAEKKNSLKLLPVAPKFVFNFQQPPAGRYSLPRAAESLPSPASTLHPSIRHSSRSYEVTSTGRGPGAVPSNDPRGLNEGNIRLLLIVAKVCYSVKAVHDNVNTFEINLSKKSLLQLVYILTGALSDMRPVKLVTMDCQREVGRGSRRQPVADLSRRNTRGDRRCRYTKRRSLQQQRLRVCVKFYGIRHLTRWDERVARGIRKGDTYVTQGVKLSLCEHFNLLGEKLRLWVTGYIPFCTFRNANSQSVLSVVEYTSAVPDRLSYTFPAERVASNPGAETSPVSDSPSASVNKGTLVINRSLYTGCLQAGRGQRGGTFHKKGGREFSDAPYIPTGHFSQCGACQRDSLRAVNASTSVSRRLLQFAPLLFSSHSFVPHLRLPYTPARPPVEMKVEFAEHCSMLSGSSTSEQGHNNNTYFNDNNSGGHHLIACNFVTDPPFSFKTDTQIPLDSAAAIQCLVRRQYAHTRVCGKIFNKSCYSRRHERTASTTSPFLKVKHYDIGTVQIMQGDTLKEHIYICKGSSTGSQQVMSPIPGAVLVGTDSSGDNDETVNAQDGNNAVESVSVECNLARLLRKVDGFQNERKANVILRMKQDVEDDHEDSINDNDYGDSVDEVSDEKYDDSFVIPTHSTTEFPSTSGMKKAEGFEHAHSFAATSDMKKAEYAENNDYIIAKFCEDFAKYLCEEDGTKIRIRRLFRNCLPSTVGVGGWLWSVGLVHCSSLIQELVLAGASLVRSQSLEEQVGDASTTEVTGGSLLRMMNPDFPLSYLNDYQWHVTALPITLVPIFLDDPIWIWTQLKYFQKYIVEVKNCPLLSNHQKSIKPIDVRMKQRWNVRAGEMGNPRKTPPTSGVVRHDSHMRKSEGYHAGNRIRNRLGGRQAPLPSRLGDKCLFSGMATLIRPRVMELFFSARPLLLNDAALSPGVWLQGPLPFAVIDTSTIMKVLNVGNEENTTAVTWCAATLTDEMCGGLRFATRKAKDLLFYIEVVAYVNMAPRSYRGRCSERSQGGGKLAVGRIASINGRARGGLGRDSPSRRADDILGAAMPNCIPDFVIIGFSGLPPPTMVANLKTYSRQTKFNKNWHGKATATNAGVYRNSRDNWAWLAQSGRGYPSTCDVISSPRLHGRANRKLACRRRSSTVSSEWREENGVRVYTTFTETFLKPSVSYTSKIFLRLMKKCLAKFRNLPPRGLALDSLVAVFSFNPSSPQVFYPHAFASSAGMKFSCGLRLARRVTPPPPSEVAANCRNVRTTPGRDKLPRVGRRHTGSRAHV
ncbi:hypothetical protein PR048_023895 [Dryococelus australis]|uniref:Uncharacterized protein n=1 Tax=Dryococelus australis TaxID=614101 RepID=A0ABQ9GVE1_9NEOP|nr:hypothetical protein PR048_023895 [Dryococelus australis]